MDRGHKLDHKEPVYLSGRGVTLDFIASPKGNAFSWELSFRRGTGNGAAGLILGATAAGDSVEAARRTAPRRR
jgi:hypothetical protein